MNFNHKFLFRLYDDNKQIEEYERMYFYIKEFCVDILKSKTGKEYRRIISVEQMPSSSVSNPFINVYKKTISINKAFQNITK